MVRVPLEEVEAVFMESRDQLLREYNYTIGSVLEFGSNKSELSIELPAKERFVEILQEKVKWLYLRNGLCLG